MTIYGRLQPTTPLETQIMENFGWNTWYFTFRNCRVDGNDLIIQDTPKYNAPGAFNAWFNVVMIGRNPDWIRILKSVLPKNVTRIVGGKKFIDIDGYSYAVCEHTSTVMALNDGYRQIVPD